MIIESGVIIFIGLLLMALKLKRRTLLRCLNYPLTIDVGVFVLTFMLHMGTFSGVMAAAVASMMCSGMLTTARWSIGYIDRKGVHHKGWAKSYGVVA